MNLMNIMLDKSDLPPKSLILSAVDGIWAIASNKIITLPTYIIYSKQAKDKDLLKLVNSRINTVRKQISRIQQFLKDYGFEGPREPNWEKKLNNEPFVLSTSILDDEEIAMGMKEHIRSVLGLETEALRNMTIPETRKLIFELMKEGNSDYGKIIELQKEKKWTDNPPTVIQQ
jgi:Protein of unknown function (DUF3231)